MADKKISQFDPATTPLSGSEIVPILQGGGNIKTTAQAIAALAAPTDLSYTAATRTLASSTGADVVLPVATTTDAGLESAADKTKLDSITVDSATVVRKLVRNNSGVAIAKGQPVYQTGSSGTTITVALADASTEATAAQTLGLAQEAIGDNATGWVIAVGELSGINTATLTEGQIVWLSETTGALTTTRPTQPAHGVVLGYCVKQSSGTSGILYVKVDNGLELEELHDVLISSPLTGQVLRRAADGLWKNATLAAADLTGLATAATTGAYSDLSGRPTLGTAAPLDVAAAGDASASQIVKGNDSRLTDSRTPTAHTQAASTISDSTTAGRALLTGADAAAQRTSLGLGTFATANAAAPPAIGGTTPAAGSFTNLSASLELTLPNGAPASPTARDFYAVADTLRYRDSGNVERLLLNGADNLANLANAATARSNLGAAASGAIGGSGLTMATARILARSSAGTGAVEEHTLPTGFDLSGGALRAPCEIGLACSDETSNLTTGAAKVTFRMPYAMTLTAVRLNVNIAPTGSALIVDVNEGGVSVFSTNPRIDAGSKTSVGSATPAVISDSALADDAEITVDVDQIGSTIAGKGLKVWLIGRRA